MEDLIYLAATISFFLLALGYIHFCAALQAGGRKDEL